MTSHQLNAQLLAAREAELPELVDPGNGGTIVPGRRERSFCILSAGVGATTRALEDPDNLPIDQEVTLIATGITGANTITITGLQGSTPTHLFDEDSTSIFRVSQETNTKIWLRIAPGAATAVPPDGDYGDIVVSAGGTVWTIDVGVVTYAKIQNVSATDRILGRVSSGAGVIEEIVFTDQAQQLADDTSFADMRTTLGLGTMAVQNANNVAITGGTITGLTQLGVVGSASTGTSLARTHTGSGAGGSMTSVAASQNSNNGGSLTDAFAVFAFISQTGTAGTITNASVFHSEVFNVSTNTITNLKLFEATLGTNTGTLTNTYAYYVGDITSGTQTNQAYAFYNSDANARSFFAGATETGGMLTATGGITLGANLRTNGFYISRDGDNEGIFCHLNGNVAIGTNADEAKLYVRDAGGAYVKVQSTDVGAVAGFVLETNAGGVWIYQINAGGSFSITHQTAGVQYVTFENTQVNFNPDLANRNFRINSDSVSAAFYLAASDGHIGIHTSTVQPSTLSLVGDFGVYNGLTDASNYDRGRAFFSSNVFTIGTENAGTFGTARSMALITGGTTRTQIGGDGVIASGSCFKPSYGVTTYAAGTAYALTATSAALDFGTTDPVIVLAQAGVYKISGWCVLEYNGATFAANRTVTLKLRRTNNTAADLTNGTMTLTTEILTTTTKSFMVVYWEAADYTTTNTNDSLTIFGDVSVVPSAGSLDVSQAFIKATRIS